MLLKREESLVSKKGNAVNVELNDCVKINYQGLIEGNEFADSKDKIILQLPSGQGIMIK